MGMRIIRLLGRLYCKSNKLTSSRISFMIEHCSNFVKNFTEHLRPWTPILEKVPHVIPHEGFILFFLTSELKMWDNEIKHFCAIMLKLEDIFAKSKTIHPDEFETGAKAIQELKTLVFEKLIKEVSRARTINPAFWQGLKFQ